VPLIQLAWARSGDKGNTSNIGVIARRPEWLPLLQAQLTRTRGQWLAHLVKGPVTRYDGAGHSRHELCLRAGAGRRRNGQPAQRRRWAKAWRKFC
jgi:hypothetical protein